MTTREKVVEVASSWIGTPFHHQAKIKGQGVDCLQLLIAVYGEAGLVPDDIVALDYSHDEHLHLDGERYLEALKAHGAIETDSPQRGDIVMFRVGRRYSHSAIVVDYPICIHAYINSDVCLVDVENGDLSRRARVFYTMEGFK